MKTWLTAVFICCRCILYPKTKVIVCAANRSQSAETITKIKEIMMESPTLRAEISALSESVNNPMCVFKNGSTVRIVTMSNASRSKRANIILVDEFCFDFDHDILQNVITNFLGNPRNPAYLNDIKYYTDETMEHLKPEYEWLKEDDKEIYLSSAGWKGTWQYITYTDYYEKMLARDEGKFFVANINYKSAIRCGLRSKKFYAKQMAKEGFTKNKGDAEYSGIWMTDADNAFFTFESLDNCRTLRKAIYTTELNDFIASKNKKFINPKKPNGAIRILGGDLAFVKRKDKNDASAFTILQLIPNTKTITITETNGEKSKVKIQYYERQLIYIETQQGMLIEKQAERLKQLFFEFDCDKMIIDAKNSGIGVIQELAKPTVDSNTGIDYPPIRCYNDETYSEICNYNSALSVLYCINATADSNKIMAEGLQKACGNKTLQLLINENMAKDQLMLLKDYDDIPRTTQTKLELPYYETRLLIEEMSGLELVSLQPFKLIEKSGMRKDRYSSLLYANGLADMLEAELNKTKKKRSGFTCKYTPQEYFNR